MVTNALTIKYDPKLDTREYNTFTEEYFSGADVALYIDGEKITNISGLQFSIQEQLKPIYGYASRTFDDMAIGNRIVIGSFRVPVINPTGDSSTSDITVTSQDNIDKAVVNNTTRQGWTNSVINASTPNTATDANGTYRSSVIYSDDTMKAQHELQKQGYLDVPNGLYDGSMTDAVTNYQVEKNLNTTGKLDAETLASLYKTNTPQYTINADGVSLRIGPGTIYKTIDKPLSKGTPVTIIGPVNDWYQISLGNGVNTKKGYVAKLYVTV